MVNFKVYIHKPLVLLLCFILIYSLAYHAFIIYSLLPSSAQFAQLQCTIHWGWACKTYHAVVTICLAAFGSKLVSSSRVMHSDRDHSLTHDK